MKMLNMEGRLLERMQKREQEYQRQAPAICQQYGLDAQTDRDLVQELVDVTKEMNLCAMCTGKECSKRRNKYQTPFVEREPLRVVWKDCAVGMKRLIDSLAAKHLSKRYADKTFDDYNVDDNNVAAVRAALQFTAGASEGIYLHGDVGRGKTFLATLIGREYLKQGKKVLFRSVPALLNDLFQTFKDPAVSAQAVLNKFIKCDLFIMDDVGAGKLTEWGVDRLYDILNERYNDKSPIVVTSNYSLDDLEKYLASVCEKNPKTAERICSRLRGVCLVAKLGGEDRRLSK